MKIIISVFDGVENFVEKEKMLVASIFSFSYNVLKVLCFRDVKTRDHVVMG